MNTQAFKGSAAKLKAHTIALEEQQQEHEYVTAKVAECAKEIARMEGTIKHYREVSIPKYMERMEKLVFDITASQSMIDHVTPLAEQEKEHEAKQKKIAELQSELRKLLRDA